MSWTTFSRKAPHSLQKLASRRALNPNCQLCHQRALTTRDAPGIVPLLFTRPYSTMSKEFCMSYERDMFGQQAGTVRGCELSQRHLCPCAPPPNTAKCLVFPPDTKTSGKSLPFPADKPPSCQQLKPDCLVEPETESPHTPHQS